MDQVVKTNQTQREPASPASKNSWNRHTTVWLRHFVQITVTMLIEIQVKSRPGPGKVINKIAEIPGKSESVQVMIWGLPIPSLPL